MITEPVKLDYRGKRDLSILDEIRELLLVKRVDAAGAVAIVDTEKFARKIEAFATITKLEFQTEQKEGYWVVRLNPYTCKVVNGSCACSQ
ncbi:hypothetical protein MNBD_NITROSPINAE04-1468 [hydrothermal vent metagenome]|uniref:Uncharacterized protein n=1 Tax=hydrothermal vent metagenome TaxID=652676 RepID=A0A3B1C629_9ZZZZ